MVIKGTAKGKTIELEQSLPYRDGAPLRVSVEPLTDQRPGAPQTVLRAMRERPHLKAEDVDELEHELEKVKLPVRSEGVFGSGI